MRRVGWWSLFWLLVALVAFDVVVVLTAVFEAAFDTDRPDDVGGTVLLLVVGAVLALAAWRVEHHARSPDPRAVRRLRASRHEDAGFPASVAPRRRFERARRRSRPRSRARPAIALAALVGMAVFLPLETVSSFVKWRTSVFTQAHGVPSSLIVVQVTRVFHNQDHGGYDTVHLQGFLVPPVAGRARTTAYTPTDGTYVDGERVAVLVDPHDPAHAELPGLEDYSFTGVAFLMIFTIVIYLAVLLVAGSVVIRYRHRRSEPATAWRRRLRE